MRSSNRHGAYRFLAAIGSALLSVLASGATAPQPGMTYESLKDLPDFGGGWVPITGLFTVPDSAAAKGPIPAGIPAATPLPPELKPEVAARSEQEFKQMMSGVAVERGYCEPPTFGGRLPMSAGGSLEILYNPGRVTIATESGLVRRIYVRDTPPPGALEESRSGLSLAHWEGQTLVVTTTRISPDAKLFRRIGIGAHARAVERFSLKDANTLEVESTVTAPDVLTRPLKSVNRYKRARDRLFTDFDVCVRGDRSFDGASKAERFDTTPPPDLPPPPPG